jgi:SAM-dependent methyltransferase
LTDSPLARTIQSYDRIVADYLLRWRDRSNMANMVERFISYLPTNGRRRPMVADIGCGPGFDAAVLRDRGLFVVGLDLSAGMLLAGRSHYPVPFVQADMRHLPLASVFDGLWVNASLLHLPRWDAPATLLGFARILRPGGCLFLSLKQGQGESWEPQAFGRDEPRFFTYWHSNEIDALLCQAGFTICSNEREAPDPSSPWLVRFAQM